MNLRIFIIGLIVLFPFPILMIVMGIMKFKKSPPTSYPYLSYETNKIRIKRELKYLSMKLLYKKLITAGVIDIIISTFILFFMFPKYPYWALITSIIMFILLMFIIAAIVDIKIYKIKKKLFRQIEKNKRLRIELEETSKEETNDNYKQ